MSVRVFAALSFVLAIAAVPSSEAAVPLGGKIALTDADGKFVYLVSPNGPTIRKLRAPDVVIAAKADLSSDGRFLAMATGKGLYVMSAAGKARRIPNQPSTARFGPAWVSWAPGGGDDNQIAFTIAGVLWTMYVNGNALMRVATRAEIPDWSPDGSQIVFVRDQSESTGIGRIYGVGTDGRDLHFIVRGTEPSVSPDGSRLAFVARNAIYVIPIDGGQSRLMIRNGRNPEWSPSGTHIAFTRETSCGGDAGCRGRIFIAPVRGGKPHPVGPEIFEIGPLSWAR